MSKYLHMAQSYRLENGRIMPNEGEPISRPYNDDDLLFDFVMFVAGMFFLYTAI